MEGRGVTNYAKDKPSYGFSTATTEFDDALISRGIVTFEQAMIAKGASPSEARRLTELKEGGGDRALGSDRDVDSTAAKERQLGDGYDDESDAPSDDDDDDDGQFVKRYRQMRLNEMRKGQRQEYGEVIHISRPDWNREVNEASRDGLWVVVNLTRITSTRSAAHDEICDKVEEVTRHLADKFVNVKFVSIPSTSAIENWPAENLPTLFCYRYGKLQHQLVGLESMGGAGLNSGRLEWRLALLGVVQTELEEDPRPDRTARVMSGAGSQFGGAMSRLATTRDSDSDDFDDVD